MDEIKSDKKSITLGLIFRWILGILFFLTGLGSIIGDHYLAAIFIIIASFVLIPSSSEYIENKLNFTLSGPLRAALVICLFIGFSANVPDSTPSAVNANPTDSAIASANDVNTVKNADNETTSSTPEKTEITPTPTIYNIGDRVVVGDMAYTVTNVRKANSVGDKYLGDEADGIFVIINMKIENLGKESKTISTSYVQIVDSQGRTFDSDSRSWIYLKDNILTAIPVLTVNTYN